MRGIVGENDVVGSAMVFEIRLLIAFEAILGDADRADDGGFENGAAPERMLEVDADVGRHNVSLDFSNLDADQCAAHAELRANLPLE
jgi:hypothetical protein